LFFPSLQLIVSYLGSLSSCLNHLILNYPHHCILAVRSNSPFAGFVKGSSSQLGIVKLVSSRLGQDRWFRLALATPVEDRLVGSSRSARMTLGKIHIVCSSLVHRLFVACSSPVHRLFIACSLPVHCLFIACSSPVHRLFIACSTPVHRLFLSPVHRLFNACSSLVLIACSHRLFIACSSLVHRLFISFFLCCSECLFTACALFLVHPPNPATSFLQAMDGTPGRLACCPTLISASPDVAPAPDVLISTSSECCRR
jgi:hypothetical protein